jgi:hypothetical protein
MTLPAKKLPPRQKSGAFGKLDPASPTFWERVDVALAASGTTKRDWARHAEYCFYYVSKLKSDGKRPPKRLLVSLTQITGCTMEYLNNPSPIDLSK